jgi:hypothetical protein
VNRSLALLAVVLTPSLGFAAPVFYSTGPYLSLADSRLPFAAPGTKLYLEDFEDGMFDAPGVVPNGGNTTSFNVLGPGSAASVENGALGHSLRSSLGWQQDGTKTSTLYFSEFTLDFDPLVLGTLPDSAGLVVTSFDSSATEFIFRAYDAAGDRLGEVEGNTTGLTGNRFLGVTSPLGISRIHLITAVWDAPSGFQVDHVQFRVTPEPSLSLLMFAGSAVLAQFVSVRIWRRRMRGCGS